MSDSAGFHVILRAKLGNVVSGSFTFNRGVGGEDHFSDFFLCQTLFQTIKPDIIRTDAVQRLQMPHQHKITT